MKMIKLPAALPGTLDLALVNEELRARESQLNWSEVESAPAKSLSVLLAGLDLSNDADVLGVEGAISEQVAGEVLAFFESRPASATGQCARKKPATGDAPRPQVWSRRKTAGDVLPEADRESRRPDFSHPEPPPPEPPPAAPAPDAPEQDEAAKLSLAAPTEYEMRAELETAILNDLLGPAGGAEEEVFEQSVSDRYLVGLLAPQHRRSDPEVLRDELAVGGRDSAEEGKVDAGVPLAQTMFPSSLGMTFCVSGDARAIRVRAAWGSYTRTRSKTSFNADATTGRRVWRRAPVEAVSEPIKLAEGAISKWVADEARPDVYVQGLIRRQEGEWIVSLFLVNGQREPNRERDAAWLFQPELSVESADDDYPDIFLRRPRRRESAGGDTSSSAAHLEDQGIRMLYRRQLEFAVGHGVSVHADTAIAGSGERAVRISTSVAPCYEVPKTTPPTVEEIPALAGLCLDMKLLAETEDFPAALGALPLAYERWIAEQRARLGDPAEMLGECRAAAELALESCTTALGRIREGLELLARDETAAEVFRFMNRAMWLQRVRSMLSEQVRRGQTTDFESLDEPRNRTWFPFQLAFILLNLPSLTDLHHPDRCHETKALADLLWFPTGGGKTEAYLGLTAYTLGLRRRQGVVEGRSGEHGVGVLMRYTLRLLTLQQFQRAAALICACESIRREAAGAGDDRWGREPFRLGLWVGMKTTPNKTEQSEEYVLQIRGQRYAGASGSPHQLTNCPWCGAKIDEKQHITVDSFAKGAGRTLVYCGDALGTCLFTAKRSPREGLPVLVVDEEIYRRLPALLIATVDKFAQMPWKGAVEMLFGQVDGRCDRHGFRSPEIEDAAAHQSRYGLPAAKTTPHNPLRPPDLVIQDELHLISGPLGTLVGLYETAVDQLSSWEVAGRRVRPKVIASTATIRQAAEQVRSLFLRDVHIFPPQGLDAGDNFFSRQRTPGAQTPGRRYLGICAPGRRLKVALIRVYIAQLAAAQSLYEKYGSHADPWMTLVGYFGSLRELGGMRRLVDDDVRARLGKMDKRGLAARRKLSVEELTSRKSSTDIPHVLDRLESVFDPVRIADIERRRKAGQRVEAIEPLDVLLATNMISVGVDVKRLGGMVVAGQPKTTAEYIQATSRVGRSHPGLVVTVYNWARPRDLSHYETFEHYHATFYQHVEALSVTPFAAGAIDRGLAGLLVSLVRLAGREFNENAGAARVERNHPYVRAAVETILRRAREVGGDATHDYVQAEIARKLDIWLDQAKDATGGRLLGYESRKDGLTIGLLKDPAGRQWDAFSCLRSLRNVEPSVGLILHDGIVDEDANRVPRAMNFDETAEAAAEEEAL